MATNAKPDMTYRFSWDAEPTDEQLAELMREVGAETRRKSALLEEKSRVRRQTELLHARAQLVAGHGKA